MYYVRVGVDVGGGVGDEDEVTPERRHALVNLPNKPGRCV